MKTGERLFELVLLEQIECFALNCFDKTGPTQLLAVRHDFVKNDLGLIQLILRDQVVN